jgi:protein-tyrosine phosphatase
MHHNTVLFLCSGNYYRSRFAEILFNHIAADNGLRWKAESRGLALEWGVNNVGPISELAVRALQSLGISIGQDSRFPLRVVEQDFETANLVIAVKEAEHRPLVQQRFSGWAQCVEYWSVHDLDCASAEEALPELERQVRALAVRLLHQGNGGTNKRGSSLWDSAFPV